MKFIKSNFLNEDFDDIEMNLAELDDLKLYDEGSEILNGPAPGPETGISSILINAITDTWNTINNYNSIIATLVDNRADKLVPIIKEIVNTETLNVGQLQKALELVSPNTQLVDAGAEKVENVLAQKESPMEELIDDDFENWKQGFFAGLNNDGDDEFNEPVLEPATTDTGYILDKQSLTNAFNSLEDLDD